MVGDLMVAWRLLVGAETALAAVDSDPADADRAFYNGKVATATFFAKQILPRRDAGSAIISALDGGIMTLVEGAF